MAANKYVSDVKLINQNIEIVYNFLSDFNNLGQFFNEYTLAQISQQMPKVKIEDFRSDIDSCVFKISSVGEAGLRIIEREPTQTIKLTGEGKIPFELYFWIQLVPAGPYQCKIRLTLHAHLNMMLKMVLNNKLKEGINTLAETLTRFPYR